MQQRGGRWAIGGVVVATEDGNNNGWDLPWPQRGTKDTNVDDCHYQGDNKHVTTMATPSASSAADADNIKDEDAREMKEDDGDNKMSWTNKVGGVGATPTSPTTPILVTREVDQGLQPVTRLNNVAQDHTAT